MIIDFHVHTHHSYDSDMQPEKILSVARSRGLTGIVVCDHGTIRGGMECRRASKIPGFVLAGAEIASDAGDVIGFPLNEEIRSHRFEQVVEEIRQQGGLVLLPHPFKAHRLDRIDFSLVDLIEGYNARLDRTLNEKAVRLAAEMKLPVVAGSDAHLYSEIGNARTFYDSESLREPLRCEWRPTGLHCEIVSQLIKARKTRNPRLLARILLGSPRHLYRRAQARRSQGGES